MLGSSKREVVSLEPILFPVLRIHKGTRSECLFPHSHPCSSILHQPPYSRQQLQPGDSHCEVVALKRAEFYRKCGDENDLPDL